MNILKVRTEFIFLCLLLALIPGCKPKRVETEPAPERKKVRITSIVPTEISLSVNAGGFVSPAEEIRLSFKTGGIIESINTKEGAYARKGDILASLNLSEINNQVIQARNGYEKVKRDHERAINLYRDSVATLEQVQNAETALNLAKSALEIADFNMRHSQIVAPADGIILKQLARINELIAPGYPVFLFGSTSTNWRVRAGLADRDIVRIKPGDSASVTMDAWPGITFPGYVNQVGEMANPGTGTYEVEILLDRTNKRLVSGFMASARIFISGREPLNVIPIESLIEAEGSAGSIFTLVNDSIVKKHSVDILSINDSGVIVKKLPAENIRIVTEGAAYLDDGDTVNVVR